MSEQAFIEIFSHRIDLSTRQVRGGWVTFKATKSEQTMGKFVARAKEAGARSAFCRGGRVGCLVTDLE